MRWRRLLAGLAIGSGLFIVTAMAPPALADDDRVVRLLPRFFDAACDRNSCSPLKDAEVPQMGALIESAGDLPVRILCNPTESDSYGFKDPESTGGKLAFAADGQAINAFFSGNRSRLSELLLTEKDATRAISLQASRVFSELMFSQVDITRAIQNIPGSCRQGLQKKAGNVAIIIERYFGQLEMKITGALTSETASVEILQRDLGEGYTVSLIKQPIGSALVVKRNQAQLFAFRATPIAKLNSDYRRFFR